jgi:hypothetical protein
MPKPLSIEIVRRAYELWQQAGEPKGRGQEFYLEAERRLTEAAEKDPPKDEELPHLFWHRVGVRRLPRPPRLSRPPLCFRFGEDAPATKGGLCTATL